MVKPLPLIVHKEEQLVFLDRSAESSAVHVPTELVARNLRSWINFVFPLVGVELVVPEKLPYIAVKRVGAGFEGCADDATHKVAEFRRRVVRDQVEFFDRVGRRRIAQQVVRNLVVVHSVENKVICLFAVAVDKWS